MSGSSPPIAVAHGEGRAVFGSKQHQQSLEARGGTVARYIDNDENEMERVLAIMPHPERTVLSGTGSWLDERMIGERVRA